jgi:hypothetical protein
MPVIPQHLEKEYPSAYGPLKVRFRVLTYKYVTFTMSVSDFPLEYVKSSTVDTILVSARDSAINEVDGTLIDEKAVVADNLPGREVRYNFGYGDAKRIARARIFLGGNRLFQLHATVLETASFEEDIEKFLNSVKISKDYKIIASESADWNEMISQVGRFKILAVGSPYLKEESTEGVKQPCYFFNSGGSAFAISWMDSEGPSPSDKGAVLLDEAVKATLARSGAKTTDLKDISSDDRMGREFSFKVDLGYICRCRFYYSNGRLYQLAVTSPVSMKDTSDIDIFLKSFQILVTR